MKGMDRATKAAVITIVGAIALLLAVNVVARLIVRWTGADDDTEFVIGLWSLGAMLVVAAAAAFVWTKRHVVGKVVGDALIVVTVAALLVALAAPFASGNSPFVELPFAEAVAKSLILLLITLVVLGLGAVLGSLLAMALGLDPKSRAWKAQAASVREVARKRQRKALSR